MKRLISLSVLSLLCFIRMIAGTSIVYMNVGDTRTLSFSAPTYIVGTQWTISDQDALQFSPTPGSMAVTATVKALKARSAANRVIVRCTYYYRELNPANGKYEYQRTGYQDWEVIIRDSGSGGGGNEEENPPISGKKITCNPEELYLNEYEESEIRVTFSDGGRYLSWGIEDPTIAAFASIDDGWILRVKGLKAGSTIAKVGNEGGGKGSCKIIVNKKYFENDEIFTQVIDNIKMRFQVIDATIGTCALIKIPDDPKGHLNIPSEVCGLTVVAIDSGAISLCGGLTSIDIPNSVTTIGDRAFASCIGLISVTIPSSVTVIDSGAFSSCTSLTSIEIPQGVTEIGREAFRNCNKLKSVTLPKKLQSLGDKAFYECEAIREIIYEGSASVKISEDVFAESVYNAASLYVTKGCKKLFENAYPWNKFGNILELNGGDDETLIARLQFKQSGYAMTIGETLDLNGEVIIEPEDATNRELEWKSSDEAVATVSDGIVTVLAEGECEITATSTDGTDRSAVCIINAQASLGSIESADDEAFDVFSIDGVLLMRNSDRSALSRLDKGVYIIRSAGEVKKIAIK